MHIKIYSDPTEKGLIIYEALISNIGRIHAVYYRSLAKQPPPQQFLLNDRK